MYAEEGTTCQDGNYRSQGQGDTSDGKKEASSSLFVRKLIDIPVLLVII